MKDEDAFPVDTVVRIKKTGQFALIKKRSFLRQEIGRYFLYYLAEIEGRKGLYSLNHGDIELEALPCKTSSES